MEIYRDSTTARVLLPAPAEVEPDGDTIDIKALSADGTLLHTFDTVIRVSNGFVVNLPWRLTRKEGEYFVDWDFTYVETDGVQQHLKHRTLVQVVTPILSLAEVKEISEFEEYTDIIDIERQVRYAIQSYTGQNFGRFDAQIALRGRGDYSLQLPYPLLQIGDVKSSVNGFPFYASSLRVSEGGWALTLRDYEYYGSIKSAPPEEALDFYVSTGVIRAPSIHRPHFRENHDYVVRGEWGFYDVPGDVQQAARMLIADYSCDEALWRDRYIDSIRAADWRFEFNKQAFSGTGNVQVDHILDTYRRMSLAVI